ncbi:MAG: hypothetical protein QOD99_3046 [Chthoniobacter sp.]|nr:hypothetical protein [Chthoniobacter sp.]
MFKHVRFLIPSAFRLTAALALVSQLAIAQEVRRAVPANEAPVAPAVPFDFDKPAAAPSPRPRSAAPPTVSDETGARTAPAPPDSAASVSSSDQIQLEFANGFYARKIYDAAAPEYEKYLGIYANAPERQTALFRLGECYRLTGNLAGAKTSYQTLVTTFVSGEFVGPAAYRLGDLYYAEKNYSAAVSYYRKASVRVKDPAVALAAKFYAARCLENIKSPAEARSAYEDIIATKGDNPFRETSRLALAKILIALGRKEEALRQLDAAQQEASKPEVKVEALVKSGLLKIELGQAEKGAADLKTALKMPQIGQWQPIAEIGLLRVLYETGKYQQLIDTYDGASKNFPPETKPEVLLLAANAKRQLGDHQGARAFYEQVAKDYPGTTYEKEAAYERLVSLYSSDDPGLPAAVDEYLTQNSDADKRDQILLLKAEALFKQQKYSDALPVYAAMSQSKLPANMRAEAQFKLGWCSMQVKDNDRAIAAFSTFLDGNPQHKLVPSALAERAVAYQQSKNLKSALKDFNDVIARFPKAKERELALQQKALILGQQQDNAGMAQAFKQLLKDYPQSTAAAQANYWIGWVFFTEKDYKAAVVPLLAARQLDKEQFFERATMRLMLSHYYLEDREALAQDVDSYMRGAPKAKVPAEVLRWLGGAFLKEKNFSEAEKYLEQLAKREGESQADDSLNLARAQLGEQKFEKAAESVQAYLDTTQQPLPRATGLLVFGEAQLALGKFDEGQKAVDDACALQPEGSLNAKGRMLSGDIAAARGDLDQASKIYRGISVIIDDPELTPRALEKAYQTLKKSGGNAEAARVLNELQTRYPEYQLSVAK